MARTLDQLAIIANQIKDATLQGENTADRVGGLLVDLIDFLRTINVDEIALSPLLTALNESGLVDPQDGQILKFKSSEDNWVFSSDITQITNTIRTILDTLGHLDNGFVKKTGDIMTGLLTTLAGIKVRNFLQLGDRFVSGLLGEGAIFRENVGGRTYLEADEMYIRVKAYFDTVEIRKFLHSGGNRIASVSGAKCIRVEMLNSANEIVTEYPTKYRCYFRASDGDNTVTNDFVVGDQAYCHITNATNSSLNMHHYWRLVVGKNESPTENGEHWIDLSNQESETIDGIIYSGYLNISDAPIAQDDIIQLGNVNDITRRGAIIEFVSGNDAPSYQIFQGLGDIGTASTIEEKHNAQYSYTDKNYISLGYNSSTGRAYLNVFGDFLFGDRNGTTYVKYDAGTKQLDIKATVHFISPTTHQETTLDTFASAITGGLENLQRQIDGEIDTWFYNGTPGPSVLPESEWVAIDTQTGTNNERLKHLGDLYYDNSTGYAYRYTNTGSEASPVFTWSQISDSAVIKALEDAAKAQDTADHKRRTFVTTAGVLPTPPYSEGDLWVNATYPFDNLYTDDENHRYYKDLLKCTVPATYDQQGNLVREGVEAEETPLISHWNLASKYTDDSYAKQFDYLKTAIQDAPPTQIQGGLILASTMAMRDLSSNIMSGISGLINESLTDPMMSIAAWFGGGIHDFENPSDEEEAEYESLPSAKKAIYYAKSLFRHNGSGYLAGGNITWDSTGALTVQGQAIKGNTYYLNGVNITTVLNNILSMFVLEGDGTTENPYIIKANYGLYTEQSLTALGKGEDESHEIGVLNDLNDVTLTNPTANQILVYDGTHWRNQNQQSVYELPVATTTTLGGIMLGYAASGKNYAIQLDANGKAYVNVPWSGGTQSDWNESNSSSLAYIKNKPTIPTVPTNISAFTNDSGYITSSGSCNYANSAGSAGRASLLQGADNRDNNDAPSVYMGRGYATIYTEFSRTGGAGTAYNGFGNRTTFVPWGDNSGGRPIQLEFNGDNMYIRSASSDSAWNGWRTVIDSGNIGSQSVNYANSAGYATNAGYASSAGYASYLYALVADNDYIRIQGGSDGSNAGYLEIATADDGTEPIYVRQYTGVFSSVTRTLTLLNSNGHTELPGDLYVNGGDFWLQEIGGQPRMIFHIPNVSWGNLTLKGDGQFYFYQSNTDGSGATVNVGNLYSTGAVSALSDIRHKEIVRNTNLQVEQIAAMRSVIYRKKDSNDNTLYAGSIAQDWQSILPQVVSVADNDEHTLSLQYGVAALIAVITTARKVAEHERRIADLERENERLKGIINNLNVA